MGDLGSNTTELGDAARRVMDTVLTIGENRLALFKLEVEEERDRILRVLLLSLAAAVFGLLAGIAATVAIAIFFWDRSPLAAMLVLVAVYAGGAVWFYALVLNVQRTWETLPGTIDQLRKDRECLERRLV